jgi:uncharacterized membrane protein
MAEREAAHRQANDTKLLDATIKITGRGQIFALIIALGSLGTIVACLLLGQPLAAIVPGIVALTSLAATFLGSRRERKIRS